MPIEIRDDPMPTPKSAIDMLREIRDYVKDRAAMHATLRRDCSLNGEEHNALVFGNFETEDLHILRFIEKIGFTAL